MPPQHAVRPASHRRPESHTLGGVNHCRSHCRLAKSCGLMYRGKYSAVIGLNESIAWKFILGTYTVLRHSTNHSAVFPLGHQTTEFRQTTV
jgi:hypothetical protein